MNFPLINISEPTWNDDKLDIVALIVFDPYAYTERPSFYDRYMVGKSFCDCNGEIFIYKKRILPESWWRKTFKFLPNVYKVKLIFESTGKTISVDELRNYLIERIAGLPESQFNKKWIDDLKAANTHEDIICCES